MPLNGNRAGRRYRQFLHTTGEDPMGGVADLFDAAMVLAVSLIPGIFNVIHVPAPLEDDSTVTVIRKPGRPDMPIIRKRASNWRRTP